MDPAMLCQLFFSIGAAISIGGTLVPSFKQNIMTYGSRREKQSPIAKHAPQMALESFLDYIASFQVPHSWFTSYYIVSVASSLFWAIQFYTQGSLLQVLAAYSLPRDATMTTNQILLAWLLMAIQGTRRLYESIIFRHSSQSTMWCGLWIIGMAFYIAMSLAVWIEGIELITDNDSMGKSLHMSDDTILSKKTAVGVLVFFAASIAQYDCHSYLAQLKKYSLPQHRLFRWLLCPHYTSECFIYFALCVVSAPSNHYFNQTVLAALTFVIANLAVTAASTREWYNKKFGELGLGDRKTMVPYVY